MNRESFERQYQGDWQRLEDLLDLLDKGDEGVACEDFPELYRRVCHHLSLVRSRLYGTDLEQRLNALVLRGHHQLYRRAGPSWSQARDFILADFPRLVRREARLAWLALALFFGPLLAMSTAVTLHPDLVYAVLDPETAESYQSMYDPSSEVERQAQTDFLMFGYYVYNNVSIAFQTFASGILFAVGSIFFLVYNGVAIGTVAGLIANAGFGEKFFPFVIGHGSFELIAIALAGAAGLKLGLALLAPGRRGRWAALVDAARQSVRMVYGIFGMLVVAAFVEAFWSSSDWIPAVVKYAVGTAGWVGVAAYFLLAGRGRAA